MKYRYEIVTNNTVKYSGIVDANLPAQVLRKITENTKESYLDVFLLNEKGILWNYGLKRQKGQYKVYPIDKKDMINHSVMMKALAGNVSLKKL